MPAGQVPVRLEEASSMINSVDVVVIGAGAIGASIAFHLAAAGVKVALLDRHGLGSQTSPRAAGLSAQVRPSAMMTRIAVRGVEKLLAFTAETGEPLDVHRAGSLKIARTAAHAEQVAAEVARGCDLGVDTRLVTADEAQALNPFLEPVATEAISFTPGDVYLDPAQLPLGYARAATRAGCELLPYTAVEEILVAGDAVEGVRCTNGVIRAPVVVDAAGAWLRQVAEGAPHRLPLVATRHQLLITKPIAGVEPLQPITRVVDANVYIRPCDGGLMLGGYEREPLQVAVEDLPPGSTIDDMPLDLAVLRGLADLVVRQFPIFREIDVASLRGGLPTMTPDDQHVLGPVPGLEGFFVAGGCNVGGLSTAPAFGELMAALIVDGRAPYDITPLSPERFAGQAFDEAELGELCRANYASTTGRRPRERPPSRTDIVVARGRGGGMDERLQRTAAAIREVGADWGVLTSIDAVAYATGHVSPIEAGPSPFAGGPTLALIAADGTAGLVTPNIEATAVAAAWVDERVAYEGYTVDHPATLHENHLEAVRDLAARLGVGGTIAVEPASLTAALDSLWPQGRKVDLTEPLRRARATKTAAELVILRRCAAAAAVGQRAFLRTVRPGRSELAVFADIRCAMEEFAGERVAVAGDFLSGRARTAAFTGWPSDRVIEAGDPVLADLAPRLQGYWGDSCAAVTVGAGDPRFARQFAAAKGALTHAVEIIRPGITAAQLDAEVRSQVERAGYRYPHHSGHSIGTAVHEHPRIVPYDTTPLEPDMVLMIEPGAYDAEVGGVRTEWMIRVTGDGCEPMAPFEHVMTVAADGSG